MKRLALTATALLLIFAAAPAPAKQPLLQLPWFGGKKE